MTLGGHRVHIFPHRAGLRFHQQGRQLRVELHRPIGSPAFVLLVWPAAPTVSNANPKAIATIAAATVRIMAEAQARLATVK
jgi:hypothetical protein